MTGLEVAVVAPVWVVAIALVLIALQELLVVRRARTLMDRAIARFEDETKAAVRRRVSYPALEAAPIAEWQSTVKQLSEKVVDPVFAKIVGDWSPEQPSLNAFFQVNDILKDIAELQRLSRLLYLRDWFFELPRELSQEAVQELFNRFYNPETGGYCSIRTDGDSKASICGTDSAWRLFSSHLANQSEVPAWYRKIFSVEGDDLEYLKKTAQFIEDCKVIEAGRFAGFKERPEDTDGRTLFTTFAGFQATRNLCEVWQRLAGDGSRLPIEKVTLEQAQAAIEYHSHQVSDANRVLSTLTYKRRDDTSHCLSATHHGLRALASAAPDWPAGYAKVREFLRGRNVVDYVKECWDWSIGGFSGRPDRGEPDIMHTRDALQLLRTLLSSGAVAVDEVSWVDPAKVLRFILSSECYGGFGLRHKGRLLVPCLYTTRMAVNSVKLLRIFELRGVFPSSSAYREGLEHFLNTAVPRAHAFVEACRVVAGTPQPFSHYSEFPQEGLLRRAGLLPDS